MWEPLNKDLEAILEGSFDLDFSISQKKNSKKKSKNSFMSLKEETPSGVAILSSVLYTSLIESLLKALRFGIDYNTSTIEKLMPVVESLVNKVGPLFTSLAEQYIDYAFLSNPSSSTKNLSLDIKTAIEASFFGCINNHVLPSVRCLADAIPPGEERIRKFLNHQLLLQTKGGVDIFSSAFDVRSGNSVQNFQRARRELKINIVQLAAISGLKELVHAYGEEYIVFLPESLSYLSELLESGEEKVENATKDLIVLLETISGEDIENYLV